MNIGERIGGFAQLGKHLGEYAEAIKTGSGKHDGDRFHSVLDKAVTSAGIENPWFTRENILSAMENISASLERTKIEMFVQPYSDEIIPRKVAPHKVGVIMAGNIPLVGFHDFFCTLIAGHHFLGKLSSDDRHLLPAVADILCAINPAFGEMISFSEGKISGFSAVIATGSNNTNRYFEYYFGKYPNILRKTRSGLAILTGKETNEELSGLADDIFMYFGRGCRSISKLYLPEKYDFNALTGSFKKHLHLAGHNKYCNNYNYHRAVFLLENVSFIDCGNIILVESSALASPVSVVYYEYYADLANLGERISELDDRVQCIVCADDFPGRSVRPGTAQQPELWDYADGIDTMQFLLNL